MTRGASMTTDKHVDPTAPVQLVEEEDADLQDAPEGTVPFELDPEDIADALAAPSLQVQSGRPCSCRGAAPHQACPHLGLHAFCHSKYSWLLGAG
jgi:hypothetical protein